MQRAGKLFAERLRDPRRVRDATDRLIPDVAGDGIARADVIIEAIFENVDAKRALFAAVEKKAKPDAILATNTSSIPLEEIASALRDPTRLIGLHFFNPVARMMLVEIVRRPRTRDGRWSRAAAAFVRQIDKLPLPVKSAPGFLVNRMLAPYLMAAIRAVDEGIAPETVDEAALAFGMPMGPIELADTVGLDICVAVGKLLGGGDAPPRKLIELVAGRARSARRPAAASMRGRTASRRSRPPGAVPAGLARPARATVRRRGEGGAGRRHRRRCRPGRRRRDLRHRLRAVPRRAAALRVDGRERPVDAPRSRCPWCRIRGRG